MQSNDQFGKKHLGSNLESYDSNKCVVWNWAHSIPCEGLVEAPNNIILYTLQGMVKMLNGNKFDLLKFT